MRNLEHHHQTTDTSSVLRDALATERALPPDRCSVSFFLWKLGSLPYSN